MTGVEVANGRILGSMSNRSAEKWDSAFGRMPAKASQHGGLYRASDHPATEEERIDLHFLLLHLGHNQADNAIVTETIAD